MVAIIFWSDCKYKTKCQQNTVTRKHTYNAKTNTLTFKVHICRFPKRAIWEICHVLVYSKEIL